MNEVIQNILNRRSVRAYSEKQIKPEELELILKCGMFAPSACNQQSWHFTVVQNKELIKTLSNESKKELLTCNDDYFKKMGENEKYNIFYDAPTIIIVSGEKQTLVPQTDCSAATENMMLAAESLNIGSCWIGLVTYLFKSKRAQEYVKMLEIPQGYEPYYAITLGYKKFPNQSPQPRREKTVNYVK